MIKIKVSTNFPDFPIERQTPDFLAEFNGVKFYINQEIDDFDYWVVYNDLLDDGIGCCPKGGLILFTAEPESVQSYPKKFLEQFDVVVTSQKNLQHPNKILSHTALPWHIGRVVENGMKDKFTRNYDELSIEKINKTKLISVISSNKAFTKGHRQRLEFVKKLKTHFGDVLDVYGRGINDFSDKWDVIAPYKYHIVLENTSEDYYWTEKLADCYLGEAYPIYYGCSNIGEYFDNNSLSIININNPESAIKTIEFVLKNNLYEQNKEILSKSKKMILNKYNFFASTIEICKNLGIDSEKKLVTLKNQTRCMTINEKLILFIEKVFRKITGNLF